MIYCFYIKWEHVYSGDGHNRKDMTDYGVIEGKTINELYDNIGIMMFSDPYLESFVVAQHGEEKKFAVGYNTYEFIKMVEGDEVLDGVWNLEKYMNIQILAKSKDTKRKKS